MNNRMNHRLILITALFAIGTTIHAQTAKNCSEILAMNPSAASGVYTIDPDGAGAQPSMSCYCDMTTDGGGWTLLLNYNHLASTNPSLDVLSGSLPLQGETSLGFDESNSEYWGHADTALANAIPFNEIRFYGITSEHSRIIHFKSMHAGTISYFKTGIGSTSGISSSYIAFNDHTANLPASIDMSVYDKGNFAMTDYPLWTASLYHWFLGGNDVFCSSIRWEVDDYPCYIEPSTLHQIWVRQKSTSGLMQFKPVGGQLKLWPNPAINEISIEWNSKHQSKSTLCIYNNSGKLVFTDLLANEIEKFNISGLVEGMYLVVVTSDQVVYHQKLVVQK